MEKIQLDFEYWRRFFNERSVLEINSITAAFKVLSDYEEIKHLFNECSIVILALPEIGKDVKNKKLNSEPIPDHLKLKFNKEDGDQDGD